MKVYENLVAIEGIDGSGKATQTGLISNYFSKKIGKSVLQMSFPQYGQPSAVFAEKYLNGEYGGADDVAADLGSLIFALDRFAAKPIIENHLNYPNSIGILDRFVGANLAHQGTKIPDRDSRLEFYERIRMTEFEIFEIPKPIMNIVLLLSTDIAQINVDSKSSRSYTTKRRDIHEESASHLDRASANYIELCQIYPDEFTPIQCIDETGRMRTPEDIQTEVQQILRNVLNI